MMKTSSTASASERCSRRSEEHTSELQSQSNLVCRLLLEKKKNAQRRQRCSTPPPTRTSSRCPRAPASYLNPHRHRRCRPPPLCFAASPAPSVRAAYHERA